MKSDIVLQWKDPLYAVEGDARGANPAGRIELSAVRGGLMLGTLADGTYACCGGGTEEYLSFGCC